MVRKLTHIAIITTLMALTACGGTVRGIGNDISNAGKAITKTAS